MKKIWRVNLKERVRKRERAAAGVARENTICYSYKARFAVGEEASGVEPEGQRRRARRFYGK
jgi:hypothetical protein